MSNTFKNYNEFISLQGDNKDFKAHLYADLYVPSEIHGVSLSVELMKKWFVSKFEDNFFNRIHINGKHIYSDFKRPKDIVKTPNPILVMVPNVDWDYDRESIDWYPHSKQMFVRIMNQEMPIIHDYDSNINVICRMKQIRMTFGYRIRLNTRAQQVDLYSQLKLLFKVGSTEDKSTIAEFHVPTEMMLNIAKMKGFEINGDKIVDINGFLRYMNSISDIPIIYKFRGIKNKEEFFLRASNIKYHINLSDKLQLDDGDNKNMLTDNYNIDFVNIELLLAVPHFYVLYANEEIKYKMPAYVPKITDTMVPMYTFSEFIIPKKDEHDWGLLMDCKYITDIGDKYIDIDQLITGDFLKVYNDCLDRFVSPNVFMNIIMYIQRGDKYIGIKPKIDYKLKRCIIPDEISSDKEVEIYMGIYCDLLYYNDILNTINKPDNGRIELNNIYHHE